ncbi:MAG: PAS domain-containing protein [Patescibacteria group bacterium]|nr:PAS domain-containing protein [Patescibacteria group bacterium]
MNNDNVKKIKLGESRELALHHMAALVEVARESFLILDSDQRVVLANPIFYETFQVTPEETENKLIYELGNGQWNIPELKKLMEEILPKQKVVKNYEVSHFFETIGEKTMVLNARQIDSVQLIILAIEDATASKELEKKLAEYTRGLEIKIAERTAELAARVKELESVNKSMVGRELKMMELKKEIADLKKRIKNGNGKNGNGKNGNGNHNNGNGKNHNGK